MADGFQVIARLPYRSTRPKALATASEVATMDLARHYGIPTPLVYGCSTDSDNPVGSGYIIMEKIPGQCLGNTWDHLADEERVTLLENIVNLEMKLFKIPLVGYGSIYYEKDLPKAMASIPLAEPAGTFCIGPNTAHEYWSGARADLDITRCAVLEAPAIKEAAWLRAHAKPRLPFERAYRESLGYRQAHPTEHLKTLEKFIQIAPQLVPKENWLHQPVLRHPDLHPNNILIDDDGKIVGLIDWQHSRVLPLFLHTGIPGFFRHVNFDNDDPNQLKNEPELAPEFDELDEQDQQKDLEHYRRRHAHFYYMAATAARHETHHKAMAYDPCLVRKKVFRHVLEPWEGNSVPLKTDIIEIAKQWPKIASEAGQDSDVPTDCPISFSEEDIKDTVGKALEQDDMDSTMKHLRDVLGCSSDGWVPHERYEKAMAAAVDMKEQALRIVKDDPLECEMTRKHWPLDDFDEDG